MELQKTKDISYALKTIEGHFPAAFRPVAASPRQAEPQATGYRPVSYTHLRAHETGRNLVCRLLLEKKKEKKKK